jgi:lipid kinase YegS
MAEQRTKARLFMHKELHERSDVAEALDYIRRSGIKLDICTPSNVADLRNYVSQAIRDGAVRIVVGGGDGTLNIVVNAMMRSDGHDNVSLGILPLGTANDFAKSAGIDRSNLISALKLACTGVPTAIDVGRVGDKYFINAASGGFGAEVTATTPSGMKRLLGDSAYTIMGFVKAFQLEPCDGRVILPNERIRETSLLMVAVNNGRFAGGGFEVAPRASLTDGLLDVIIFSGLTNVDRILEELGDLSNPRNQHVLYRRLSRLRIETRDPLHLNLDGEPMRGSHFEFRCCPQALHVVLGDPT